MENLCRCRQAITKSYIIACKNKCPNCSKILQKETAIDENLFSDKEKNYDVPRTMKTHQEGTMENTTSNSNVDHINFLPHPQPDRRESGSDQSYSDDTVTRDVITELGRVLKEMNHTKRAFSRRHKPEIPKFPAKDMTLDVFFIKLMSYIEIMEIAGGRDLQNLLVHCLEGDALKLYIYVADGGTSRFEDARNDSLSTF